MQVGSRALVLVGGGRSAGRWGLPGAVRAMAAVRYSGMVWVGEWCGSFAGRSQISGQGRGGG
jgi:hypothetical protein